MPSQQLPLFELLERGIETDRDGGQHAGILEPGQHVDLRLSGLAGLSLELERVGLARVPQQQIGRTRGHAKAFEDGALDRRPRPTVGRMQEHDARNSARPQMRDDAAMDDLLRPGPAVAHYDAPSSASTASTWLTTSGQ